MYAIPSSLWDETRKQKQQKKNIWKKHKRLEKPKHTGFRVIFFFSFFWRKEKENS